MKILLCTNQYQKVSNGPVKFARMLEQMSDCEVRILTEDIDNEIANCVYRVVVKSWQQDSVFSQVFRMWIYHQQAMRIKAIFNFDVLIYNHALIGLWSAFRFSKTVGMINDNRYAGPLQLNEFCLKERLKYLFFRKVESLMYLRCAKVLVNSHYLKAVLQENYGNREKVYVLYKGVDIMEGVENENSFDEPIKLLFVKSDFETGGLQDVLRALPLLEFEHELRIVCHSSKLKEFVNRNTDLACQSRIVFHNYLAPPALQELLNSSNIVCIPSHRESLGVVNLEALACGVSVVTTNVGGIPEVLDDGNNGWMIEPANKEQLALALNECVANIDLRQKKRENGLMYAKKFSKELLYRRFQFIMEQPWS